MNRVSAVAIGIAVAIALALVTGVNGFPHMMSEKRFGGGGGDCSGAHTATNYFGLDQCVTVAAVGNSSVSSYKWSVNTVDGSADPNGRVKRGDYSQSGDCTGANTLSGPYALASCNGPYGDSYFNNPAVPGSAFVSTTNFAAADCTGAVTSGPVFARLDECSTSNVLVSLVNGQLQFCTYPGGTGAFTCTGTPTCTTVSKGCSAGASYDVGAASTAAAAPHVLIAAVAIAMAIASARRV